MVSRGEHYAITSFIFGMDNDTGWCSGRTVAEIEQWARVCRFWASLTPLRNALYTRLEKAVGFIGQNMA